MFRCIVVGGVISVVIWLLIISSAIIAVVLLFFILKTGKLQDLLSISRLKLDGVILIKSLEMIHEQNAGNNTSYKDDFKGALIDFNNKYDFLQQETDYEEGSIIVRIKSQQRVLVKNNDLVHELVDDLDKLLKLIPHNGYLIRVKLSGELTSFFYKTKISISNKNNQVGLNEQKAKKSIFRYVKSSNQ